MAYVGMTRGKGGNHVYIYKRGIGEGEHKHTGLTADSPAHRLQRGSTSEAAQYFRAILANDDRTRTLHAEAELTRRDDLPAAVANLLSRNNERRHQRAAVRRQHAAKTRVREVAYERIVRGARGGVGLGVELRQSIAVEGLEL